MNKLIAVDVGIGFHLGLWYWLIFSAIVGIQLTHLVASAIVEYQQKRAMRRFFSGLMAAMRNSTKAEMD